MDKIKFKDSQYQEDEIDLRELFNILNKRKILILSITLLVTIGAIIYAYSIKPIFEVKSNVEVGYIGQNLIVEPDTLVKRLNIIFDVDDKSSRKEKYISEVTKITTVKGLKNFIEIKTEAISNDEAIKKNKEVVEYIVELYKPKIEQHVIEARNNIESIKRDIDNIDNSEIKNTKAQIKILQEQDVVKIDEEIKRLKEQDIKKLKQEIELLKIQKIVKIDEQIKFLKNIKLNTIESKINFHTMRLDEYNKSVNKLFSDIKSRDTSSSTIASIQMVNYQNLILNSQNNIEDLKVEKEIILTQTIPNLEIEKKNILDVTIRGLELQIENINNVTIAQFQRKKENISNEQIRKLQYKVDVKLEVKKIKLNEQIENLKYSITNNNLKNCEVVGSFIVKDYPIKPKKKLIVVVVFVSGFILSIFLVFLLNFIRNEKDLVNTLSKSNPQN